ncbi:MAG: hypothetical protein SFW65_05565, partial [Alphaproteobacteria bacterium]|nr:hypothetical protein [Alphaproteobacteria bacterium]
MKNSVQKSSLVVAVVSVLALAGCAGSAPTEFAIPAGALEAKEIPMDNFSRTTLASRVFDVVNQDTSSET